MSKTKALVMYFMCFFGGIAVMAINTGFTHIVGAAIFVTAFVFLTKFWLKVKRDLMGHHGSQAVLAARRAQPPTIQKMSPGSNMLTFKRPGE